LPRPPAPPPAPSTPPSSRWLIRAYYEFIRGRVLEGEGDGNAAVEALRRAAARDTGSAEIRAELAGLLARAGREGEAMTAANEALQRDPANAEAHWVLGTLYASRLQRVEQSESAAATADIASAIGHLEQARPNRKYDLGLLLTLGRLQLARGNAQAAIEPLNALWQQEPGVADAGLMLAQAYEAWASRRAIGVLRDVVTTSRGSWGGRRWPHCSRRATAPAPPTPTGRLPLSRRARPTSGCAKPRRGSPPTSPPGPERCSANS
jgi:predicted Zn-dependent protease